MEIDPSLHEAGHQCGVDVKGLLQKYSGVTSTASQINAPDRATSASNKLDRIVICHVCQGYGLVKEIYNHQVKELNCTRCEGDGIVRKEIAGSKAGNESR